MVYPAAELEGVLGVLQPPLLLCNKLSPPKPSLQFSTMNQEEKEKNEEEEEEKREGRKKKRKMIPPKSNF